jgi:membrane protein implicated in regulation of membrane protease activity
MQSIYLGAIAFGVTLLLASFVLGGKDTDHGGGHAGHVHGDGGVAFAPFGSLRFWVFLMTFGGGAGFALGKLGTGQTVTAIAALVIGWTSGVMAVTVIRRLGKNSASSEVVSAELVGQTGTLVLPVGPGKPGKVRIEVKGRAEDFVATTVDDAGDLPTGSTVLIVAEGEPGSLLVSKSDV